MEDPRILVADDEAVIRNLFKRILESKGHQVVTAKDGSEALDKIKEEPFDVIFLDIVMPGIGGLKACQTIERINPEVKIVMMTGYGTEVEEEIERSLKAGAYECLYKPFTIQELLDTLEKVLKK
ncbi:response regulator [bacterium]|nr:response regulator [bacterium]MBU4310015.1 response regulator [bacterium]MBU4561417.1 response regulator [bacterium]MCG2677900.1 response regulator [bacterium]